jgi:hypothetical protein
MWKALCVFIMLLSSSAVAAPKTCLPRMIMILPGLQSSFPVKGAQIDVVSCWVDAKVGKARATSSVTYHSIAGDVTVSELIVHPKNFLRWNGMAYSRFAGMTLKDTGHRLVLQSVAGIILPEKLIRQLRAWFQVRYVPEVERAMREAI